MHVPREGLPIHDFVRLTADQLVNHPELRVDRETAAAIAGDLAAIVDGNRDENITRRELARFTLRSPL